MTPTPVSIYRHTSVHQELHTALSENSLLHWETLLVAASHDLEDIPLELISQLVTADLLGQSLVVELATEHKHQTKPKTDKRAPMLGVYKGGAFLNLALPI